MATARDLVRWFFGAAFFFCTVSFVSAAEPAEGTSTASGAEASSSRTGSASNSDATGSASARSGTALRDDIRAFLRDVARQTGKPDDAVVRRAVCFYQEIQVDTQLRASQREPLRVALRNKLARWGELLAQERAAAGKPAVPASIARPKTLAQAPGQPGQPGQLPGAATQPPIDHGQELLELIQDTIAPTTWDVQGGNGVVRYWAPGHALIIRQTGDVHEQLGRLLMDMR